MKTFLFITLALIASLSLSQAQGPAEKAWDTTKETAKDVGHATKETAKDVGHTLKRGTKKVVHKITETVTPDVDAHRVEVKLTANRIDMDKSVPAGKTAFVVTNNSNEKLTFQVEGQGIDESFSSTLAPQQTKVYTVDLDRGHYKVGAVITGTDKQRVDVDLRAK